MNQLYYGDNLDILRRYIPDESVDLVYLDPPFKSSQDYNVLFAEQDGSRAAAQIKAFEDTWRWDQAAATAYQETVEAGGRVSQAMQALRTFLGNNDMLAYLSMMAPRLVELRRVLKVTGSIYLHCDPTASHYLRVLMDAIFGEDGFRNEITWRRSFSHNDPNRYGANYDTILFYSKSKKWVWNLQYTLHRREYIERDYRYAEGPNGEIIAVKKGQDPPPGWRRFRQDNLTANRPGGDVEYEWKGAKPYRGRYWAYSRENMEKFEREGRLLYRRTGMPVYKRYLDEMPGVPLQAFWDDIPPIISGSKEMLGYPTQKPEALLERIIKASSNEGDLVLDPFCGCGTTIAVAQRLNRRWIGIDITQAAMVVIKKRLRDRFGDQAPFKAIGEPVSSPDAKALAEQDPYQFQWWALDLVGARPVEGKKGADRGIDGRLYFHDEPEGGKTKQIIFSVKSGNVVPAHLRDLRGVLDREQAEIGVLLTLKEATKAMRKEAAGAGFYVSPGWEKKYPRLQLLTIEELLAGKGIDYPPLSRRVDATFKKAPRATQGPLQAPLDLPMAAEPVERRGRYRPKSNLDTTPSPRKAVMEEPL